MTKEISDTDEEPIPKSIPMSQATKKILEERLKELETLEQQAGLEVGETGGTSDWHDNPALEIAQHRFARIKGERIEVQETLNRALIVEPREETDEVGLGNQVRISLNNGPSESYELRTPTDSAVLGDGVISNKSPIGAAIVGLKPGESASIDVPDGTIEITIQAINPGIY